MASDIVQYIIIRGDLKKILKWSTGALVAQACHAVTAVNHIYRDDPFVQQYLSDMENMHKVVLEAKDEDTLRKLELDLVSNSIQYKMWVEQPENTPTCIAAKPYPKDQIHKFFKKLKLFKDE